MSRLESGIASDPATAVASRAPSETAHSPESEKHHPEMSGINVQDAEKQFHELSRRLTRQSTRHGEKGALDGDIEKQETFDLLEYLRSTSGKQDEAGFAHKHVGVTFDDLRVIGAGGVKICKWHRHFSRHRCRGRVSNRSYLPKMFAHFRMQSRSSYSCP